MSSLETTFPFDPHTPEVAIPRRRAHGWNAGVDGGLLVMRLVLGATFVGHGCQKLFGAFGGPGVDGFAAVLAGYGYRPAHPLSLATGAVELAGGALVGVGLLTSLAAAGLLGIMVNAVGVRFGGGYLGGVELDVLLAALAAGLTLAGPGRLAADNGRVWFRHQVLTGWTCVLVGAGAGTAFLLAMR